MAFRLDHEGKHGVAVARNESQVFLAWVGLDDTVNIISTHNGRDWSAPTALDLVSIGAPALCSFNNSLYLAWAGEPLDANGSNLHVMSLGANGTSQGTRRDLPYVAGFGPAITDFKATQPNGGKAWQLWLAWTAPDGKILTSTSANGQSWDPAVDLNETSIGGPSVWGKAERAWIAWAGTDLGNIPHQINVKSTVDGQSFEAKHTFSEGSEHSPALVGFRGSTWLMSTDRVSGLVTVRKRIDDTTWPADPVRYLSYGDIQSNLAAGTLGTGFCLAWLGHDRCIRGTLPAGPGRIIANPTADMLDLEPTADFLLDHGRQLRSVSLSKGRMEREPVQALLNEPCYYAHVLGHGSAGIEKSPAGSSVADFQGDLHVAWPDPDSASIKHVKASRPKSWSQEGSPAGATCTEEPTLCQFNSLLYAAWSEPGSQQLKLASSSDGETFTAPQDLGETSPYSPAMTVLNGRLYLAWTTCSYDVVVECSTDGQQWTDRTELGERTTQRPALIGFQGKLHLAWVPTWEIAAGTDTGNLNFPDRLSVLSSTDGVQWANRKTFQEGGPFAPAFAANGDHELSLLWTAEVGTRMHMYSVSSFDGAQWNPKVLVADCGPWSEDPISGPSAEFWNGCLHVSWTHNGSVHIGFFNEFGFRRSDLTLENVMLLLQGPNLGPDQVRALANGPSELFVASACLTASNDSLARAFFAQGTRYYLGFAGVVRTDGISGFAKEFFARWERENKSIWQVLDEVDDIHPLTWYLFENEDVD